MTRISTGKGFCPTSKNNESRQAKKWGDGKSEDEFGELIGESKYFEECPIVFVISPFEHDGKDLELSSMLSVVS